MERRATSLQSKLTRIREFWSPKVVAEMNNYQFKLVKLLGDFVWHCHPESDETFVVLEGSLRIDFRDGHVQVSKGEMYIVPRGVEHKPYAEAEVHLLLIEPRGIINTGDEPPNDFTTENQWI